MRNAEDHFANIFQFVTIGIALEGYYTQQKKELVVRTTDCSVIVGHFYKMGKDKIFYAICSRV